MKKEKFEYRVDRFADIEIFRYKVKGWENLPLNQKKLIFYLSEAALQGRDIIFDQKNRYNLAVRRILEAIYSSYQKNMSNEEHKALVTYLKRIWFSNGIHHHYGAEKFLPDFSKNFFTKAVYSLDASQIPKREGQSTDDFLKEIIPIIFDPDIYPKRTTQDSKSDVILTSANNYYGEGISQLEVEQFYENVKVSTYTHSETYGLNSRLIKKDGTLIEELYKIGGLYSQSIEKIIFYLKKAGTYAETDQQRKVIDTLIEFYKTGCLKQYDKYSIQWVKDTESNVDFVNGFTETYGDALGIKGNWESIVSFKDKKTTSFSQLISDNAQWFEDHSPIDPQFKKKEVKGITAKAITVCMLGGDCYPCTPVGINLPNSNWIRKNFGSKSVTISNIIDTYDHVTKGNGFKEEFVYRNIDKQLIAKYGSQTNYLHVNLHECIGHASGKLLKEVEAGEKALKMYGATIEEARADLFALYYMPDAKIIELGLLSDPEAYKAGYYLYLVNGAIVQLASIELGKEIEEAHMRNRALIANYLLDIGKKKGVAGYIKKQGKTYIMIFDYVKMRQLIGELLCEIQRIRSEGDIKKAQYFVKKYAIHIDRNLHQEVLKRYAHLNIAPHKGFVNPAYEAIYDTQGNIIDVKISYTEDYVQQMLRYSHDYSFLPTYN